mgnify:CR=1 FL=1
MIAYKGENGLEFVRSGRSYTDRPPILLRCGRCRACRLTYSREWAIRCIHEASLHRDNAFLTLTYRDADLPDGNSLCTRDVQLFVKRMRKRMGSFRFFHCGEYGEENSRPHYHMLVFGKDFEDKKPHSKRRGHVLYNSGVLDDLWGRGFASIGSVTLESASYTARYIMKKVGGEGAEAHYSGRKPEYVTMSRLPGIGFNWIKRFLGDVYPDDFVVWKGRKIRPPKYYDDYLKTVDFDMWLSVMRSRRAAAERNKLEGLSERRAVKRYILEERAKLLKRDL